MNGQPTGTSTTSSAPKRNQRTRRTAPDAGALLRADGLFEAALGILLIGSPLTGLAGRLDLPWPASDPLLVAFGVILLPLLPFLWTRSRAPLTGEVLALAAANGAGALVFMLWVSIWHGAFSGAGAAFVLAVAAVLAVLSALQGWSVLDARGG